MERRRLKIGEITQILVFLRKIKLDYYRNYRLWIKFCKITWKWLVFIGQLFLPMTNDQ